MLRLHTDKRVYKNKNLTEIFAYLKRKNIDGYITTLSNCHLYEYVDDEDNTIKFFTDFTGDTASLLIRRSRAYLLIDGRFTEQAKKEIRDKRINIVLLNTEYSIYDAISEIFKQNDRVYIDYKIHSINRIINIKNQIENKIKLVQIPNDFLKNNFENIETDDEQFIVLDEKYSVLKSQDKIKKLLSTIKNELADDNFLYITNNLEEIAYLTNIRAKSWNSALYKAFLLIYKNKILLYTDKVLGVKALQYLSKNKFSIKSYDSFDKDIKNIDDIIDSKKTVVLIDYKRTNFYIYQILNRHKNLKVLKFYNSPLYNIMSIKNDSEIKNLKNANIIDGVAMCKILYALQNIDFDKEKYTEFDIKLFVDATRRKSKKFLQPSFDTIVAYNKNSAICHYIPKEGKASRIKNESILLIDSGGNYLNGTTDITRTISLYKDKNKIPIGLKKNFTLVLKSLINLSNQKFPNGYSGRELDLLARVNLYNEYLDFEHGTGHGIGNITNVHFGPNVFSPGVAAGDENNVLKLNQVQSVEPGLYFTNQYGIRIENNTYVKFLKSNQYGDFYGFETLTLCPIDKTLILKPMLTKSEVDFLNDYHEKVYEKLNKHLEDDILKWLRNATSKI